MQHEESRLFLHRAYGAGFDRHHLGTADEVLRDRTQIDAKKQLKALLFVLQIKNFFHGLIGFGPSWVWKVELRPLNETPIINGSELVDQKIRTALQTSRSWA